MAKFAKQYRKSAGEHGSWIVEETGLCLDDDAADIEDGCTKRFSLEALPQARGVVMKVLDGTSPRVEKIQPSTYDNEYMCVKVHGQVDPFAPVQDGGAYDGHAVLSYLIRYQEVGSIL